MFRNIDEAKYGFDPQYLNENFVENLLKLEESVSIIEKPDCQTFHKKPSRCCLRNNPGISRKF